MSKYIIYFNKFDWFKNQEHDKEKKITCPTLALWGDKTKIHQWYDVIEVWRKRAPNISGGSISAHHFLAEEKPDDVARALFFFLRT